MPIRINLKELFDSDSQSITVDKLNFNFNKMLELGIGLPGGPGLTGPQGGVGPAGIQGPIGDDGNYWFVGSGDPNSQTFTDLEDGDFYLDTSNSSIWQYNGSTNTWSVIVDFASVINSYLNTFGITFIRGLGTGSPDDNRYIIFPNRGNTQADSITDGIGGTSNNDILFLNNFNEKLGVINIDNFPTNTDNLYNAIQKIYVDSTSGIPGRYHLELGSLYTDTGSGYNLLSGLKTNLKFRHVVDDLGGSSNFPATNDYLYLGKISLSKPELALIGEINYNAALEIITPKYNNEALPVIRGEVVTRIGSKEALGEYFTDLNIDGLTIDLSGLVGKIGIGIARDFSNVRPDINGRNYLMLEGDSNIEAIYLNGKTVQNEGNIEQISTGEVSFAGSVLNSFLEEWQYNQGIAIAGNKLITVGGDRSPQDQDRTGRIRLWNINDPKNPISEYSVQSASVISSPQTRYILGTGIADVQIAGEYAYFVNNQDADTADGASVLFTTKVFARFQIGKIYGNGNSPEEITRISRIGNVNELDGAYRLEIRGATAWVICNPERTSLANNFGRLTSIDISDPVNPVISATRVESFSGTRYVAMDASDRQIAVLRTSVISNSLVNTDLLLFNASNPLAISAPIVTDLANIVFRQTNLNSSQVAELPTSVGGVKILGTYAYVVWNKQLSIYDIQTANPTTPIRRSQISLGIGSAIDTARAIDIEIVGTTAYVLALDPVGDPSRPGVIIKIDVSNPTAPFLISTTRLLQLARPGRLKYSGKYLYVTSVASASTSQSGALVVIDVDGIRSPGAHIDSIRAGILHIDKNAVIQDNLSVNHSLNVGPGGIYIDAGQGLTADGPVSSTNSFKIIKRGAISSFNGLDINIPASTITSAISGTSIRGIQFVLESNPFTGTGASIIGSRILLQPDLSSSYGSSIRGSNIELLYTPAPTTTSRGSSITIAPVGQVQMGAITGQRIEINSDMTNSPLSLIHGIDLVLNAFQNTLPTTSYGVRVQMGATVQSGGKAYGIHIDAPDNYIKGTTELVGEVQMVGPLQYSSANDILISDGDSIGQNQYPISAVNYDRIFYLSTALNDLTYNLFNGGFRITIQIEGSNIYNQAVNNPLNTSDWTSGGDLKGRTAISSTFAQLINYSFILPAGMSAIIFKQILSGPLNISDGPIRLTLHSHKFGK